MKKELEDFARFLIQTDLPQGTARMGSMENGFCCMGAGCHWKGLKFHPNDGYPSQENANRLGIPYTLGSIGKFTSKDEAFSLVEANDSYNLSFKQIGLFILHGPEYGWRPDE